MDFEYNQVIEYEDGTRDLNFEEAKRWANSNNAQLVEGESEKRTKEETYTEYTGEEKTRTVEYLVRKFTIIKNPEPSESEQKHQALEREIIGLKQMLAEYDYIGTKIATGVSTIDDYAEQIAQCEEWRARIRELEGELEEEQAKELEEEQAKELEEEPTDEDL
jgi:hypothetical protein